jgi:hypothetical protein
VPEPEVVGVEPDPLHAIAYVSTPTVAFSDGEIASLLLAARRWNAHYGVTGKLVVLEEEARVVRFAQWVEGPEAALDACFARITADPRHDALEVHFRGPVDGRRYPAWDMAITEATADTFEAELAALAGA